MVPVALGSLYDDGDVLGEEVAVLHERQRRHRHEPEVMLFAGVALLDGEARVTAIFALARGSGERDVGASRVRELVDRSRLRVEEFIR